jgi:hypothetical protein
VSEHVLIVIPSVALDIVGRGIVVQYLSHINNSSNLDLMHYFISCTSITTATGHRQLVTATVSLRQKSKSSYDWRSVSQYVLVSGLSQSQSHYDWQSVRQYVLVSSPIWDFWPKIFFFFFFKVTVLSFWGALSDERSGLSFVSLCQYSLQWSVRIYINYLHFMFHTSHLQFLPLNIYSVWYTFHSRLCPTY